MSQTLTIEVIHTFDGPTSALLEKLLAGTCANPKSTPKRKRRTAAEIAAANASGASVGTNDDVTTGAPEPKAKPKADAKQLEIKAVRDRVRAYHKANGADATKALFDGLSGASIQTIKDPADLQTLTERLDAAGAGATSTAGAFD